MCKKIYTLFLTKFRSDIQGLDACPLTTLNSVSISSKKAFWNSSLPSLFYHFLLGFIIGLSFAVFFSIISFSRLHYRFVFRGFVSNFSSHDVALSTDFDKALFLNWHLCTCHCDHVIIVAFPRVSRQEYLSLPLSKYLILTRYLILIRYLKYYLILIRYLIWKC